MLVYESSVCVCDVKSFLSAIVCLDVEFFFQVHLRALI